MMIFCDVDFFEDGYCITSLKAFWGQHFHVTGTPPWFLRPLKVFLHCRFFISQLLFHVNNILLFLSCLSLFVIFCHDFGLFYHKCYKFPSPYFSYSLLSWSFPRSQQINQKVCRSLWRGSNSDSAVCLNQCSKNSNVKCKCI